MQKQSGEENLKPIRFAYKTSPTTKPKCLANEEAIFSVIILISMFLRYIKPFSFKYTIFILNDYFFL